MGQEYMRNSHLKIYSVKAEYNIVIIVIRISKDIAAITKSARKGDKPALIYPCVFLRALFNSAIAGKSRNVPYQNKHFVSSRYVTQTRPERPDFSSICITVFHASERLKYNREDVLLLYQLNTGENTNAN